MGIYSQESLEQLKEHVDLVEVIGEHLRLKRVGSVYKGLCPFHEEKTPSFIIRAQGKHYHCFGCRAHGDLFSFFTDYLKLDFREAVENLAERYSFTLEQVKEGARPARGQPATSKVKGRAVLGAARELFHVLLLHAKEGREALSYLYGRGFDLPFIRLFQIGFAPREGAIFLNTMQHKGFTVDQLNQVGLVKVGEGGGVRPFFQGRILVPILDSLGRPLGFSGRLIGDGGTQAPKYVNTPETSLFKKSEIYYGMSLSRPRIIREKRVILVEGQLDALSLIYEGVTLTLGLQGTACTRCHREILHRLGVHTIFLAFDGDGAGLKASLEVGDQLQHEAFDVRVVQLPAGQDPNSFLREQGIESFLSLVAGAVDYLSFLIEHKTDGVELNKPSEKNRIVEELSLQIRRWNHPLMVHESLRKLAQMMDVPERFVGIGDQEQEEHATLLVRQRDHLAHTRVDPDRVVEVDLLRWLFFEGGRNPFVLDLISINLRPDHFLIKQCRALFQRYMGEASSGKCLGLIDSGIELDSIEDRLLLSEILQKKVDRDQANQGTFDSIKQLLEREWERKKTILRRQADRPDIDSIEQFRLAQEFDRLVADPPEVKRPDQVEEVEAPPA